jgi:hypothetical protein
VTKLRQRPVKLSRYLHFIGRALLVIAIVLYLFSSTVSYGLGAVGLILEIAGWIVMGIEESNDKSSS